ncbi:MAG: diaminopimelate epimerase [Candidatus Thermoplasmatota archaeon]|nr:diaminopimelate epimerase [Candidatus Thermoplasmatota archaeon]
MNFTKMQSLGNDYIIIDETTRSIDKSEMSRLAQKMCRRKFSVGADGIIFARDSHEHAIEMRIFNQDGSEAEMCGNGIRCFARYVFDENLVEEKDFEIETLAGPREVSLKEDVVRVNMGKPEWKREAVPVVGEGEFIEEEIDVQDESVKGTCVSVGNPHCVIFVENVEEAGVKELGPALETHPIFPDDINVEFVEISDEDRLKLRVWERGVGETNACGTGACAGFAAAHRLGRCKGSVEVELKGGTLRFEMGDEMIMKGDTQKVFKGKYLEVQ